ncbi:MAG: ATP-binding cassette domain-containing protein [Bacteroidia bacterium]
MKAKTAVELLRHIASVLSPSTEFGKVQPIDDHDMNAHDWIGLLNSLAGKNHIHFTRKTFKREELVSKLSVLPIPFVVFRGQEPVILENIGKKNQVFSIRYANGVTEPVSNDDVNAFTTKGDLVNGKGDNISNEILVLLPIKMTDELVDADLGPVKRFINLLRSEKKNIYHIYIYAILAGLLGLTLPLGVQSVVSLISGGLFLRPVVLLTVFVVVGVLLTGLMQIMQMTIVENVQQRIFTRTAVDFAFRIPRIKMEKLLNIYTPELVNRFFDVLTIQKGLTKILVEFITALLQILFGLLLLSAYHPFFVFFGLFLIAVMFVLFYYTGRKGLETSLYESKYKYRIAHWLEELGRNLTTFKIAGSSPLPMEKLENNLAGYLTKRKQHFKVLISQFRGFVFFKTGIVGTLLVLGSFLVIDRQISVGQFVAAELVIIIVIAAIEKLILHLDNIYDVLTAVEKLGNLTDLPLENELGPIDLDVTEYRGFQVETKDLSYKYPDGKVNALNNINMSIDSCESVAIIGGEGSGKTTLMYVISGILESYKGQILFDGNSLKDVNKRLLRDRIGDSLSHEHIFEGTFFENLTLNRDGISSKELKRVLEITELTEYISKLDEGLQTPLIAGGKGISSAITKKIVLARSLMASPKLVVFDDFFFNLDAAFKVRLFKRLLTDKELACTFLISSHDPTVLNTVDNIYVLENGSVATSGKFAEIKNHESVKCLIH